MIYIRIKELIANYTTIRHMSGTLTSPLSSAAARKPNFELKAICVKRIDIDLNRSANTHFITSRMPTKYTGYSLT